MKILSFTSQDLESINQNKDANTKIFPEIENFRSAKGLETDEKVDQLFIADAKRSAGVTFKDSEGNVKELLGTKFHNLDEDTIKAPLQQSMQKLQKDYNLSDTQIKDIKMLSTQANSAIANITRDYLLKIQNDQDLEEKLMKAQNEGGMGGQFEINKEGNLIYSAPIKLTFDISTGDCRFQDYPNGIIDDVKSNDYIMLITKVDLGKATASDYKPITTCSIYAEGEQAEGLLKDIRNKIPTAQLQQDSQSVKNEYETLRASILEVAGSRKIFEEGIKNDIQQHFSAGNMLNNEKVKELQQLNSTPKLFAEVLVEKISEINEIENDKERSAALNDLSNNAANFVDQPKGYMKILVKDAAREIAESEGKNLPKEGVISKLSKTVKLMIAKIGAKIHGKTAEVKQTKKLLTEQITNRNKNKSVAQSR